MQITSNRELRLFDFDQQQNFDFSPSPQRCRGLKGFFVVPGNYSSPCGVAVHAPGGEFQVNYWLLPVTASGARALSHLGTTERHLLSLGNVFLRLNLTVS